MQWRYAGPDRYGETKPDGDIMVEMMLAIRKLYKEQGGVFPEPILGLGIDKWMEGHEFSPANTAKVMNGYFLRDVTIGGKLYKAGHQVPRPSPCCRPTAPPPAATGCTRARGRTRAI